MEERTSIQDLFFLITFKRITLKIYFFYLQLWPTWYHRNSLFKRNGDGQDVEIRPGRWLPRYYLYFISIQWLIIHVDIPYWKLTRAGELYYRGYRYETDPNYREKADSYDQTCGF